MCVSALLAQASFPRTMPRKCQGTLGGKVCLFGKNGAPANPASGNRCSLCKPLDDFKSISVGAQAALVRTIRNLTGDQQTAAFNRLEEVPDVLQYVREALAKEVCKDELSAKPVLAAPPPTSTEELLPATQHMGMMNQGRFGLCSQFALATCAAHAIQAKYGFFVSDKSLLDVWHNRAIPPKKMWPAECVAFIGDFRFRCAKAFHGLRLSLHVLDSWSKFCTCVTAFAGFRCILVVAYMDDALQFTHSMAAIRINQGNLSATCQNSWGPDDKPCPQICPRQFVKAWAVEPCIFETVVPTESGKQQKVLPPTPDSEWVKLCAAYNP